VIFTVTAPTRRQTGLNRRHGQVNQRPHEKRKGRISNGGRLLNLKKKRGGSLSKRKAKVTELRGQKGTEQKGNVHRSAQAKRKEVRKRLRAAATLREKESTTRGICRKRGRTAIAGRPNKTGEERGGISDSQTKRGHVGVQINRFCGKKRSHKVDGSSMRNQASTWNKRGEASSRPSALGGS